ncbi:hypothetical protein QVD17_00844 [Tagetes erecta]|uniref:Transmembrane 9 superfamily member n=1 Tax=Tagetes erecta TaxID=13708 RepID=A0AAD8L6I9_TARER|nr:hypothetical protein QVD17_00844 [Tagetes erecta]
MVKRSHSSIQNTSLPFLLHRSIDTTVLLQHHHHRHNHRSLVTSSSPPSHAPPPIYLDVVLEYLRSLICCCRFVSFAAEEDKLRVKVNKLASTKTQLPYSYYSVLYCRPEKIVDSAENLGEVLRGDRIEILHMSFKCEFHRCVMLIHVLDCLGVGYSVSNYLIQYARTKEEKYFINNHLTFTVKYHKDPQTDSARIVGFEVNAFRWDTYLLMAVDQGW